MAGDRRDRGEHAVLVAEARRAAGLTQAELAECLDLSAGAVGRLEAGNLTLSVERTGRLADELGVDDVMRLRLLESRAVRNEQLRAAKSDRPSMAEFAELSEKVAALTERLDQLEAALEASLAGDDDVSRARRRPG